MWLALISLSWPPHPSLNYSVVIQGHGASQKSWWFLPPNAFPVLSNDTTVRTLFPFPLKSWDSEIQILRLHNPRLVTNRGFNQCLLSWLIWKSHPSTGHRASSTVNNNFSAHLLQQETSSLPWRPPQGKKNPVLYNVLLCTLISAWLFSILPIGSALNWPLS